MDTTRSASAPDDEPTATPTIAVATDPRTAAGQVGEILKARNAERDNVFSGVLALVGYIVGAGAIVAIVGTIERALGAFDPELGIGLYLSAAAYCIVQSGIVLMSTLPPETFDFDIALDDRRGARRTFTIGVMLLTGSQGVSFPHALGLSSLCFLAQLIWDESVAGCCRCGVREKQHESAGGAGGFRDEQGRRVHNPTDAGCGARFRPRLSDTFTLCFYIINDLHFGVTFAFSTGLCHASAQGSNEATNTSTYNRTVRGNVPNSTPMCGGSTFK